MSKYDQENAALGAETLHGFLNQFGEDIHAQILLDVLLKGLFYEESLFVFGQPVKKGHQIAGGLQDSKDNHGQNQ